MKTLLLVTLLCGFAGILMAETYTFENGVGDNLWSTAGNWTTNGTQASTLPGSRDDVVVNTAGADALQINTDTAVASNMIAGSTADCGISIGSDGGINLGGTQTFGGNPAVSVTFVNAGTNRVAGNIETLADGQVTINNSGTMQSVAAEVTIGANTVVTNSGTIQGKNFFNVSGATVCNDGTIRTTEGAATKPISTFGNGFAFENTTNGVLDLGWGLNANAGTITNRGEISLGKQLFVASDNRGGEVTVYNAASAEIRPGGMVQMGRTAGCAAGTVINEGYIHAGSTAGLQMSHGTQTILNRAGGDFYAGILKMGTVAGSMSVISNATTLRVMRGNGYGYMTTHSGTSVVHNAASGSLNTRVCMALSTTTGGFTSITNWGAISVGTDLSLAGEGATEFTMLGGTLSAGTLTNGITNVTTDDDKNVVYTTGGDGTGVLYVHGGTSTFSNVTLFDSSSPSYGNRKVDVRDPGVLVVEGTNMTSTFTAAISAGHLTGGTGLNVTYDGSDTIVTSPTLFGTVFVVQ